LNVLNCRLKKEKFKDADGVYKHGFVLMARGKFHEFFCDSKEEIDEWIAKLKASVVMLDITEEFRLGKQIGEGNFASVHQCTRKNDPTQEFAMKTIKKAKIK